MFLFEFKAGHRSADGTHVLSHSEGVSVPATLIDVGHPRARGERAFTIVEVLVAALLLTVVISGLALAVSSGMRAQSAANSSKSLYAVAQRSFDHLRGDRDWMQSCTTVGRGCNISSFVPVELLEDRAAGETCVPGQPYRHELRVATATPVDSPIDKVGAADTDQRIPDYYTVHLEVVVAACARARLGGPDPAIFESAVDRAGKVPEGSLIVEVCRAVNQVDDRSSLAGCTASGTNSVDLLPCPPASSLWHGSPAARCGAAHGMTTGRPVTGDFSPASLVTRGSATFRVVNASGAVVATDRDALAGSEPGLYRFGKMPAGVYFLQSVTPTGATSGMALWDSKMIPARDRLGNRLGMIVQPDVQSRALLTFRPRDAGALNFSFSRTITRHNVTKVVTGEQPVALKLPTDSWEGDRTALEALWNNSAEDYRETIRACEQPGYSCPVNDMIWKKVGNNCYQVGHALVMIQPDGTTIDNRHQLVTACTWYDFYVDLTYYATAPMAGEIRQGAAMPAAYATMAMPTFRHLVDPSMLPAAGPCVPRATAAFGGKVPVVVGGCVAGRDAGNNVLRLANLTAGLNAGIGTDSPPATTGWGTSFLDDGGGSWSTDRNESVRPIPAGLKAGIWVRPDGTVVDAAGTSYRPGTTIPVVGRGECYWYFNGGGERLGSCNRCTPFIAPLGGTYGGCYVLTHVKSRRHVFCTAEGGRATAEMAACTHDEIDDVDVMKVCSGVPSRGSIAMVAPNCRTAPAPAIGGGGPTAGGNSIRQAFVETGYGPVGLQSVGIGPS
ncbi:MAG: hypothetical protein JWM25_1244 [Thermoleophilia bacterium]|nr:hypothetical protein [Thermoleophilia bacterium]MCZ4496661.1 hypothetical protein [Thermoleophilia bacterium]